MNILEVHNVVKRYAAHTALDKVSLSVPEHSIYGLLGPNGAGKTSLIRIITQITAADEGQVLLEGAPLAPHHALLIGYLPEERGLYRKMKVGEQLIYLAQLKGMAHAEAKAKLKAWFKRLELTSWWEKNVEDLSKGMQQKVQFIATVLHQPKLIILDEPFSGFDPVNANLIRDEILELKRQGCTIIFSTHRMETVEELCDHVALINRSKKVIEGRKKDIKDQFKSQAYLIETDQPLQLAAPAFELLECTPTGHSTWVQRVKIHEGNANALLQAALPQANIVAFQEHIPSMNEIFIKLVGEA